MRKEIEELIEVYENLLIELDYDNGLYNAYKEVIVDLKLILTLDETDS